jgi:tetratricopeptide (TPR) repeat protein/CHAT domain-containing protein
MFHAARPARTLARFSGLLAVLALALNGPLSRSLPGQAADAAKGFTRQEREGLEARASELGQAGVQAYDQGDLVAAVAKIRQLLEICETLYPKSRYPEGHPNLAVTLSNLGEMLRVQGSYVEAQGHYQRALEMFQLLYPKDRYPLGHPHLATSLNNLGILLQAQGSNMEAQRYYERALAMFESLYPKDRYPTGHPEVAAGLNNMGLVFEANGSYVEARGYYERALAMYESLYPKARYPQGHPDLAKSLNNLGLLLRAQGSYVEARGYYERALAMRQSLYPKNQYPLGHPDLAQSLNNLGLLLQTQTLYVEARRYSKRALAMRESLYPKERYPQGHPDLAQSLGNLGTLLQAQGSYVEARGYFEHALEMFQSLYPKDQYPLGHRDLAISLSNLGLLLEAQGSYVEAGGYLERALAMCQSLYPADRYPQGHPYLATTLNNLGVLFEHQGSYHEARGYFERALTMRRSLYPKGRYPDGHPDLATSLGNLGALLRAQGSYDEGRGYYERALAMCQSLYPKQRYPDGNPELAMSLGNLGQILGNQGSYGEARGYCERALAMCQSLYPKDRYPEGHPHLAVSLNNLAELLRAQGSYEGARGYQERALAMYDLLYPRDRYPHGHPELAMSLNNLGALLEAQGSYGKARAYHERALAMYESLYPKARYPQGHPDLAKSLNNLGLLLWAQGSYVEARGYFERGLAMCRSLYPADSYPQGHPYLATSLNNLGFLFQHQGSYGESAVLLREATDMQHAQSRTVLAAASEAEAMNYLAQLPQTRDGLISVSLHVRGSDEEAYRRVWGGKSALTQILRDRQATTLGRARTDPAVRRTVTAWLDARAGLARLILAAAGRDHPERDGMINQLGEEKERLERKLAAALPEFARRRALDQSRHDDLLKVLPERTAVVDLVRFARFEQDRQVKGRNGEGQTPSYVGFVLSRGQPVRMVDLGPAEPIEAAARRWYQAIVRTQESPAAADLRRLVWEPLARYVPEGTTTLFVAPDGALCYVPWAALPGDRPGTVLLEQYALGILPHAPFLLERLTAPKPAGHDSTAVRLLAVGGVAYGHEPKPVDDERTRRQLLAARPAEIKRDDASGWTDLPGTLQEIDAVSRLAGSRETVRLKGEEAGTVRLLQELPRARWAHIATHGFFASPSIRSALSPDPKLFNTIGTENIGAGLRNPLVLSGLVLAGANVPRQADDLLTHDDHGILTAESIAGLDLSGLELAVLSACETGLGLAGRGDGVFGLQRAFHIAGAQNVVASLWKVDDQATAALMTIFYDRLWRQGKPPIEALREAQLALYHNPKLAGNLARARGTPDFDKLVQLPEPGPSSAGSSALRHAPARQWAAFVLSGYGR